MSDPYISVCLLSYERPDFLNRTIRSMVDGAEGPLQVIVHDDGSTTEVVRNLLMLLMREEYVSHVILNAPGQNEGQGIAMNRMAQLAGGDIICKCDQDLVFRQGWDSEVRRVLDGNRLQAEQGKEPRIGALGLFKYHVEPVRHQDMHMRQRDGWDEVRDFVGSFVAIPRRIWDVHGPWQERSAAFAEDHAWKMLVSAEARLACGLTTEDWVENIGFGFGPSTVVVEKTGGEPGEYTSRSIKDGPKLVYAHA